MVDQAPKMTVEPDWMDCDDTCQRCGGDGFVVTCIDDMCHGQDYCVHGDGEATCPACGGHGFAGGANG